MVIPSNPTKNMRRAVTIAANAVPKIANVKILPKFLKKLFFSILKALKYFNN